MRDARNLRDVEDVDLRVADRLTEEQLRVRADSSAPLVRIVLVLNERRLDTELGERVLEQVVGSAVDRRGRDDVVAGLRDVEHRVRLGCLAACDEEGTGAALERGEALLDDILRRVHDARVNVAELGQREEVRGVLGVVEDVRRRLIDRRRACLGGRVGLSARVDLLGFEAPVFRCGHGGYSSGLWDAAAVASVARLRIDGCPDNGPEMLRNTCRGSVGVSVGVSVRRPGRGRRVRSPRRGGLAWVRGK